MSVCYYVQAAMSNKGHKGQHSPVVQRQWVGKAYDDLTAQLYREGARYSLPGSILHNPLLDEYII